MEETGPSSQKKTIEQSILDARQHMVSVAEAEQELGNGISKDTDWLDLKRQILATDELWYFNTPEATWTRAIPRCGMEGYALVRGGCVVAEYFLSMS